MSKINVELSSFNLEKAEELIIRKCIETFPDETIEKLAKKLHLSTRTLYRKFIKYNIVFERIKVISLEMGIKMLEKNGYKIIVK